MTMQLPYSLSPRALVFIAPVAVAAFGALAAAPSLASPPAAPLGGPIATATQLSVAFSRVAEQVSPSVVSIRVETRRAGGGPFPFFGPQPDQFTKGGGSGVIVTADGAVLTNHHVIENASRIEVQLRDGRRFRARVVGVDPDTDLALLRIQAKGLTPARFADSDAARVGQWVVAIGSPFGLDYTVTAGVLSAKGRGQLGANKIEDYLQTDASINPGNSGGPLVSLRGEVLGINTMIIGRGTGIGFAIPSNLASRVAQQLNAHGVVERPWIGVSFQELTPELASSFGAKSHRGALVNGVVSGGPAESAGLRAGDIIVAVGETKVERGRDLLNAVLRHEVGAKVTLGVLRGGKELRVELVTATRPGSGRKATGRRAARAARADTAAGMSLSRLTPAHARRLSYPGKAGVLVRQVTPGSAADRAGVIEGDVIERINGKPVSSVRQVTQALRGKSARLKLFRRKSHLFTVLVDE